MEEPEVKGDAINCLRLDRSGKRLVLLARDNMVRMMDTERWQITTRFSGLKASQHQIRYHRHLPSPLQSKSRVPCGLPAAQRRRHQCIGTDERRGWGGAGAI